MALCYVKVEFEDAGPRVATRNYLLVDDYANDGSDWDAAVTAAGLLVTALDILTMDHIKSHTLQFKLTDAGAAANVAANNNVEAFTRTHWVSNGKKSHWSVPAFDDVTFDISTNGLLSAAYDTAALAVTALTRDPEFVELWNQDFSQSRGMKRGQRLVK